MASHIVRVGNVEIMSLTDGMLEFDLCNFFPTIPEAEWGPYEAHLHAHRVRFNLGSYLIRSGGRTVLVDTGLGPSRPTRPTRHGAASCTTSRPTGCGARRWTWSS
jgi:hypothetical protein